MTILTILFAIFLLGKSIGLAIHYQQAEKHQKTYDSIRTALQLIALNMEDIKNGKQALQH